MKHDELVNSDVATQAIAERVLKEIFCRRLKVSVKLGECQIQIKG